MTATTYTRGTATTKVATLRAAGHTLLTIDGGSGLTLVAATKTGAVLRQAVSVERVAPGAYERNSRVAVTFADGTRSMAYSSSQTWMAVEEPAAPAVLAATTTREEVTATVETAAVPAPGTHPFTASAVRSRCTCGASRNTAAHGYSKAARATAAPAAASTDRAALDTLLGRPTAKRSLEELVAAERPTTARVGAALTEAAQTADDTSADLLATSERPSLPEGAVARHQVVTAAGTALFASRSRATRAYLEAEAAGLAVQWLSMKGNVIRAANV